MNLAKIRAMNDEELRKYLLLLSSRKDNSCYKCGRENAKYTVNINNKKQKQQKKLCSLCDECYEKLIQALDIDDIIWE